MLDFIFAVILLVLVLIAIDLRKSYHAVPKKELKYRARHDDQLADKLYRAAAYGPTLDFLLWLVIIIGTAISLVLLTKIVSLWFCVFVVAIVLWLAFAWLPNTRFSKVSETIAKLCTPAVAALLNILQPLVERYHRWTKTSPERQSHTGVYDKAGLKDLLKRQKSQPDSRLSDNQLDIMIRSLDLDTTKVVAICLPWSKVKVIKEIEAIGPILLDELHKSSQSFIPVFEDAKKKNLVGILNMNKLTIDSRGIVSDCMDRNIYYLNEDDTLDEAIKAVAITNYPAFIVVDDQQHFVGLLSFNDIVEQLMGHIPGDNFEQYASIDQVASKNKDDSKELADKAI
jgi:CBS domain containing-hemolysin-like protein